MTKKNAAELMRGSITETTGPRYYSINVTGGRQTGNICVNITMIGGNSLKL